MDYLPGWNSIEATAWLHGFFEKSSVVLGVVLAGAIALAYLYGHRRDYLSDEATRATATAKRSAPVEANAGMVAQPAPGPELQNPPAARRPDFEGKPENPFSETGVRTPVAGTQTANAGNPPLDAQERQRPPEDREIRSSPPAPPRT